MAFLVRLKKHTLLILFLLGCLVGALSLTDYGVCWDEEVSHGIGIVNYEYIFEGNDGLLTDNNRDYGVAFELPAVIIQKVFSIEDTRNVFLFRHALSYLHFLAGCCALYALAYYLYNSVGLAILAFLLLYLHPLMFSHAFFNSKDLPMVSGFALCFYAITRAIGDRKLKWFLLAGVFTGLLIGTRITGVSLFVLATVLMLVRIFVSEDKSHLTKMILVYVGCTVLTLYVCWPFLWTAPVDHFVYAFTKMARFRWDLSVLFNGRYIPAPEIPPDYIPHWFAITTPIFILVLGLAGLLLLVVKCIINIRSLFKNELLLNNSLYALAFIGPLTAVIVLHSVLYDSWRHMFFIYPGFVMMCVFFLSAIQKPRLRQISIGITFLLFINVVDFMIKNHPLEHVYFNKLAFQEGPENLRKRYELDYWGLSYKQGLEYILAHDTSRVIKIFGQTTPCAVNVKILKKEDRNRFSVVKFEEADYFLTHYRWKPEGFPEHAHHMDEFHSIRVSDNSVLTVFKMKK